MNPKPRFVHLFLTLAFTAPALADDWPQWRGPDREGLSDETGLLQEWPEDGPPVVWEIDNAGVGYSSIAIVDGKIFTQGDLEGVEHILCFNEADGGLLWAVQPGPVAAALEAEVSEKFSKADQDGDGQLSEQEAMAALGDQFLEADGAGGGDPAAIAQIRAEAFVKALDQDGDGALDLTEIPGSLGGELNRIDQAKRGNTQELAEDRTIRTLAALDKNGDGKLENKELRGSVLQRDARRIDQAPEGEKRGDGTLTAEELTAYFGRQARGRDGILTTDELAEYFEKFHPGRDGILTKSDLKRTIGGYRNGQGDGPRGTPAVSGGYVYTEGGNGDVTCTSVETGETVWHVNLRNDFGGGRPGWGYSESPLIVDNMVVVTPGGNEGTVVALNKNNGDVIWRANDVQQGAHYSSPLVAEIAGERQIVQFARSSVFGLDLNNGKFLWEYSGANNGTANCSQPIVENDRVLVSSAYGTGTGLAKISANPETGYKAEEVYFEKALQSHHGGLVKVGDHVYGFSSGSLICMDFMTGEIAWEDKSVRKGSVIYADGMLYCLGERHEVALVEATPEAYVEKGRFSIENLGRPSWAHPAIANGRFYIRNQNKITSYDVEAK